MNTTFPRAPLAGALLLACSALAHAAPAPAPAPEPAPDELDRVVVTGERDGYQARATRTATKTDSVLRDVPQAITVVTSEVMRDQGMTSLADALRLVPGAGVAQGEGNRDTPILRGNSTTADLFVDGIRDDVQYIRDIYNVERVEVLKGPNAMIFGRGGAGGVVNRVTRVADGEAHRELRLQGGSHGRARGTFDIGRATGATSSFRVTGLFEDSESFRDGFELRRYGINPTFAWQAGESTSVLLGYEHFDDERVADRGVPSLRGVGVARPVDVAPGTFVGSPGQSPVRAQADAFNALVEHRFASGVRLRNRTRFADYDKFYQNVFANGVVREGGTLFATLAAYNNATQRTNLFNQTDIEFAFDTGAIAHRVLVGTEFGRQDTQNQRGNAVFPGSNRVPLANPRYTGTVGFVPGNRNRSETRVVAAYVQDQIEFSPQWQAIVGLRRDRFEVDFDDLANGTSMGTRDDIVSPRIGLVWKPIDPLSVYASYSTTTLPRAGEQLASLNSSARFDPEEFRNYEIGAKWEPRAGLMLGLAAYRLDRSNVVAPDPRDPLGVDLILVDGQRNEGVEVEFAGEVTERWRIFAGYAYQEGEITQHLSSTTPAGTRLAQLPRHSASLWNRVDLGPRWGLGVGVSYRDDVFAALPAGGAEPRRTVLDAYTRVDAAVFFKVNERLDLQLNVENLFDRKYFANAHSNDNLSPGSPRAAYLSATLSF